MQLLQWPNTRYRPCIYLQTMARTTIHFVLRRDLKPGRLKCELVVLIKSPRRVLPVFEKSRVCQHLAQIAGLDYLRIYETCGHKTH